MSIQATIAIDEDTTMSTRTVTIDQSSNNPTKEFLYDFSPEEDVGEDVMVWIVDKEEFDSSGYISDQHIDDIVYSNVINPEEFSEKLWECMESCFEPSDETWTKQDVHDYLATQPNFTYHPGLYNCD